MTADVTGRGRSTRDHSGALGDRFDLARYHEAVLAHGTIPVKYLPDMVQRSLEATGAGKRPVE